MIPNVRYLSRDSTYAELQELLINMPKLKAFPIVEDSVSKILIGSCSRAKLFNALNSQVGPEARQREANRRIREAIADVDRKFKIVDRQRTSFREKRPSIFDHLHSENDKERRTNTPIVMIDNKAVQQSEFDDYLDKPAIEDAKQRSKSTSEEKTEKLSPMSKKRTQSTASRFTVVPVPSEPVPGTRSGGRRGGLSAENLDGNDSDTISTSKLSDQSATTESLKGKHSSSSVISSVIGWKKDRPKSIHGTHPDSITRNSSVHDVYHTIGGMIRTLTKMSLGRMKHKINEDYDLSGDEKREWELNQLAKRIDFDEIGIDPAPFQLVEHSNLFKVHSLFSLLGLNRAYVTKCGKLVGVVALKDLRTAIEKIQAGLLFANSPPLYEQEKQRNSEGFEGAHIVGGDINSQDDDNDEDVQNDRLNPRLEVLSRVSSQYGEMGAQRTLPSLEVDVKSPTLQVPMQHLSISSDPCISIRTDKPVKTEDRDIEADRAPEGKKSFVVHPVFEISPSSSPVPPICLPEPSDIQTDGDCLSPPSRESNNSICSINSSASERKKSRHVQICVPPTPDYKKNKESFDFSTNDEE